jgi:putative ABC transport system substrate-binding protein
MPSGGIGRRVFGAGLCGALAGAGRRAAAQARVPHVAFLWLGAAGSEGATLAGLRAGLRDAGYREGENIVIDEYYADGQEALLADRAAEVVAARPDVIVAPGSATGRSVARLTTTIPIVSVSGDPLAVGLVKSLSRPGGNITGFTVQVGAELAEKWLQVALAIAPQGRTIAFLQKAQNPFAPSEMARLREAAAHLTGIAVDAYAISELGELPSALAAIRDAKADALIVDLDPSLIAKTGGIVALAGAVPTIGGTREFAELGGLASYGASIFDIYRRGALYIDRILKGAKPGDLPIEQPTRFELVINLRTVRGIGLALPPALLAEADDTIE